MDELAVTVTIAGRPYRLVIDKKEEEVVKQAARLVEKKVAEYSENYSFKDKQDLLAMVALQHTTSLLTYEKTNVFKENKLTEKLAEINQVLDQAV